MWPKKVANSILQKLYYCASFLGLQELEVREKEVKIFEESVEQAQKEAQIKGVKTVRGSFRVR